MMNSLGLLPSFIHIPFDVNLLPIYKQLFSITATKFEGLLSVWGKSTALAGIGTSGILVRTGAGTAVTRAIAAGTGISIADGTGVGANPTISASLASQAQAEAGTDNTTLMTPLRVAQAVAVGKYPYKNLVVRTTSGTFTPISGVTEYMVVAIGGGAGGSSGGTGSGSWAGGQGGRGGVAANKLTISSPVSFTIGAGGAGTNSGIGGTGGTTTFSTLTSNGGLGGTQGVGGGPDGVVGPNGTTSGGWNLNYGYYTAPLADFITFASDSANNTTGTTAAVAYTLGGGKGAGYGGTGEANATANNASGGVGGAVLIFY
jgi:hypothetical protein